MVDRINDIRGAHPPRTRQHLAAQVDQYLEQCLDHGAAPVAARERGPLTGSRTPLWRTPLTGTFTIEMRYRTKERFGNITQKGQATTTGGQWKIQNPQGRPSCLFKGSIGRVATRVPTAINDNLWHVLTCVLTPTRVTVLVDGVEVNHQNGSAGTIDNDMPMTVGGKINCDQIKVTCDYFSGDIDYIRIYKG